MNRSGARVDWLVFIALGVMWGSSYLFIKIGVESVTPMTLVALRLGVGALFLGAVFLLARERLPRSRPAIWFHLTVMAVLNIVLPFSLVTWAELEVPSSLAAILTAAAPLYAIVIAALTLRDEPVTLQRASGLVSGFVGVRRAHWASSPGVGWLARPRWWRCCWRPLRMRPARSTPGARSAGCDRWCRRSFRSPSPSSSAASWRRAGGTHEPRLRPARHPRRPLAGAARLGPRVPGLLPAHPRVGRDAHRRGGLSAAGGGHRARGPGGRRDHRPAHHRRHGARHRGSRARQCALPPTGRPARERTVAVRGEPA